MGRGCSVQPTGLGHVVVLRKHLIYALRRTLLAIFIGAGKEKSTWDVVRKCLISFGAFWLPDLGSNQGPTD